jgi:transposase
MSRDLLIQRVKLGKEISSVKNSIIGYLKRESVYDRLPESSDTFSELRRRAMHDICFGDERDVVLKTMFQRLELYERQCEPIEESLRKSAGDDEQTKLLMTIPGVNYYLASLLSSYIGSIDRFESDDKLASYFGVIPAMKDSSNVRRRGRMSKDGSSIARWALSMAVDTIMERNRPLHE